MNIKSATLLAAIGQLLATCCDGLYLVRYFMKLKWAANPEWFITQPIYFFTAITMTIFFFTLYARQKGN